MKPMELESADEIIELAERIKKIMNPKSLPMPLLLKHELASAHEVSSLSSFNNEQCSFAFDKEETKSPLNSYRLKTPQNAVYGDAEQLARGSFKAVFLST